jgi:hypothetical protein
MSALENEVIELANAICYLRTCTDFDASKAFQGLNEIGFEDVSLGFVQAIYSEYEKGIKANMKVSCDDCLSF